MVNLLTIQPNWCHFVFDLLSKSRLGRQLLQSSFFFNKNVEGGEADATCLLKLFKRTHFHIPRAAATWAGLFCSQNMQCWKHVRLYLDQYTAKNSQIDYNSYQIITHIQFNSFENVIFTSKGEFKKNSLIRQDGRCIIKFTVNRVFIYTSSSTPPLVSVFSTIQTIY